MRVLYQGDCLDHMATMDANSVDTIITDPPYGLSFMGKDWDHGIPGVPFWAAALRVAKPGATLLAFGGTRTHHRLMCAIEDAGWEIRDTMMWVYGSGFPKSHDISKAIDKAAGAERDGGVRIWQGGQRRAGIMGDNLGTQMRAICDAPATPDAALWHGWGTALKPAWEPIIVAQKPLDGTYAANALRWGVAGLWVDGGRIGTNSTPRKDPRNGTLVKAHMEIRPWMKHRIENGEPLKGDFDGCQGRWPANVVLSHTAECRRVGTRRVKGTKGEADSTPSKADSQIYGWATYPKMHKTGAHYADADGMETVEAWECAADCPVRLLDEQSGVRPNGYRANPCKINVTRFSCYGDESRTERGERGHNDTGGASRFFYCAKASRSEREAGLEGCEARPGGSNARGYVDDVARGIDRNRPTANHHPCVKPVALLRYLCRLTRTPTGGNVYDPFMGSGSTGVSAVMEDRAFIGSELEPDYYEIARRRIEHAQRQHQPALLETA